MSFKNSKSSKNYIHDFKKSEQNFVVKNKYAIIITIGFFLITGYITFFHHDYWFEYDGIYYLHQGEEILKGNGDNVRLIGATVTGPVIYSIVDSVINDGFLTLKLFALFGGTAIIFVSYFIIKNIYNEKIAIISQLLIAFNARFILLTTWSMNEQLPMMFIFLSLYFMTKKELKRKDIIIIGIFLGISFSIRYQALFILIPFLLFLLIRNKNYKINFMYVGIVIAVFLAIASPVFLYNYVTYGSITDSDPNYYILQSKIQTPEWRDGLLDASAKEENVSAIFLDFGLFLENYFYNLFYHNSNFLFNFDTWVNLSIIPIVPYLGMIPVILGLMYILKIKRSKITIIVLFISIFVSSILIIKFGEIENHFFALVMIPILVIGIMQIQKIEKQILPLLMLSVIFFIGISIVPLIRAEQLFAMWIIVPILTTICLTEVIPRGISKLGKNNSKIKKSSTKIVIVLIVLVLLANAGFSYKTIMVYFYDDMPSDIKTEIVKLVSTKSHNQAGMEIKKIGDILAAQSGIENSYVMSDTVSYSYYSNSKFLFTSFQEGKIGDSINKFIIRENWSDYEIYFSNINSHPPDRKDENKPIPDYIIFHELSKTYTDNPWDKEEKQYDDLTILLDPINPKIPNNFELMYMNNKTGTVLYKIKH